MISRVNSFRSDPSGHVGAAVMLGFAVWAGWRWAHTGLLFFLLLLLRDVVAAWFLITRRPDQMRQAFGRADMIAYVSSAMPLFYLAPTTSTGGIVAALAEFLPIVGFSLSTLALLDLGQSFGVSPANRGRVESGVYRVLQHPMYVGYAVAEFGMVILNPINLAIWCASILHYRGRAVMETRVLSREALVEPIFGQRQKLIHEKISLSFRCPRD